MATITANTGSNNWNTNGAWVGSVQPTAVDDVVIPASATVTIPSAVTALGRSCTVQSSGTLAFAATTSVLTLGDATAGSGNVAFSNAGTITLTAIGTINFISTSATQQTITSGGAILPNVTINGAGSSYKLSDAFDNHASGTNVTVTKGTFNTNGQTFKVNSFLSNNSNTRTITFGASVITVFGANGTIWNFTTVTGLTFNANTSAITCSGGTVTFVGGGQTFNNVTFSGSGDATITGANTFNTLTRTGSANTTDRFILPAATTTTCTNFTCTGNSTKNRVKLQTSNVFTGRATISVATTVSVTNTDLMGIAGAGAASWNVSSTSTGDCGFNTALTTTTPTTVYWSSGTNSMSTTANWFLGSGGTGGAGRIPLPQDTAVFDANSFTAGSQTFTFDMPRLPVISCTSVSNSPTLALSLATHQFFGNITLCPSMTFAFGANTLAFNNFSVGATITSSTATYTASSGTLQATPGLGGQSLTFADSISFPGTGGIASSSGTVIFGTGITVTTPLLQMTGGLGALTFGTNSTLNVSGTSGAVFNNPNSGTVTTAAGASIVISTTSSSSRTFAGGGKTYPSLVYTIAGSTGSLAVTGANTFPAIQFSDSSNARTLTLPAATTTTITNGAAFSVNGTAGNLMTLNSDTPTSAATLSITAGRVNCDYLTVTDNTASTTTPAYCGNNGSLGTNTSNWVASASPDGNMFLVF